MAKHDPASNDWQFSGAVQQADSQSIHELGQTLNQVPTSRGDTLEKDGKGIVAELDGSQR